MDKDNKDLLYKLNDEETPGMSSGKESDPADKPLYVIEESEKEINKDEPVSSDATEETADDAGEEDVISERKGGNGNALLIMLRILMSPHEGWKSLKRQRWTQESLAGRLFYPLLALATVTKFIMEMVVDGRDVTQSVTDAIVVFISFFFGYFIIQLLESIFLPADAAKIMKTDFGKNFLMMNLSTFVLFYIINVVLPMFSAVTFFLPIWTIFIICRGMRYLRIPEKSNISSTVLTCMFVIGVPLFCFWIFGILFSGATAS